jgi:hypothetical protein
MSADGFHNFWPSFYEENAKYPFSNPFHEACSGSPEAACDSESYYESPPVILKIVPKAGLECTLEKFNK